jgi:hypothetical protein
MLNYYAGLKEIRELNSRRGIIQYNEYLNGSVAFKRLSRGEQICLKCALYNRFKELGCRDSKNFSFLIATRLNEQG